MIEDPATLDAFVRALPKTETHVHIEGAVPYDLLRAWDPARYEESPDFRQLSYRYRTFPEFEKILLDHALPWYTTVSYTHLQGDRRQGVRRPV